MGTTANKFFINVVGCYRILTEATYRKKDRFYLMVQRIQSTMLGKAWQ